MTETVEGKYEEHREYRAICEWMVVHGVLNAPMSERARQLLHRMRARHERLEESYVAVREQRDDLRVDNERLRAAVDAAREFDAHVDGCWTTEQTHLIAAAAQAKFRAAVRALDGKP